MAPSYYSNARTMSSSPPTLLSRLISALPSGLSAQMQRLFDSQNGGYSSVSTAHTPHLPRSLRRLERSFHPRKLLSLPHVFIAVWVVLLLWGERWVFRSSVEDCRWENWERWPKEATPHHLVFIADPQLIDAHSYPGRPWPLDKFTVLHTDNYMKRSYISLQEQLHPDTIFFLGDLFDGGREWKTAHGNTQDPSWANGLRPSGEQVYVDTWGKRYGEDYWLHEYDRFGRIFYDFWNLKGLDPNPWQRGRKIISTLPGNHDLGFGQQVKIPIRNRFETYFGEGNRVDVIGNHTFVSIDAVSLSAGGAEHATKELTQPVEDFLANVQSLKRKAVQRELSIQAGQEKVLQYVHKVEDLENVDFSHLPTLDPGPSGPELPTVLLTHVPLYREPGTPCGPMREHWPPETPPKGQTSPVFPDHRNAISISKGYQYQNVLSEQDSVNLVHDVGNVKAVFSGDDHDYCEIVHPENKNSAREITVKSTSWAMGVRKPGFLLFSMWNPIDASGQPLYSTPSGHGSTATTMESHLCLLPDQLGIFIRYLILLVLTLLTLTIRAILVPILNLSHFSSPPSPTTSSNNDFPLLPTTQKREPTEERESHRSSNSSSNNIQNLNLAPRSSAARTRSVSPAKGYGLPASQVRFATLPLINAAGYNPRWDEGKSNGSSGPIFDFVGNGNGAGKREKEAVPLKGIKLVWREAWTSIWRVAWVVICVYLWLAYYG
ncbi:related to protein FR, involved in hyphal branching [Phialocephala subalpina]|uniref:Related to protein FR, involved in hyphal branching n=1 Tax=Phialocephala subalpina TaxID=576137 RepID=A0A1L7WR08_9HELO|nr:related to protein FR, involved in hyphal branching [Phialocephala subalpina]